MCLVVSADLKMFRRKRVWLLQKTVIKWITNQDGEVSESVSKKRRKGQLPVQAEEFWCRKIRRAERIRRDREEPWSEMDLALEVIGALKRSVMS